VEEMGVPEEFEGKEALVTHFVVKNVKEAA
jgi:hypothetical protein